MERMIAACVGGENAIFNADNFLVGFFGSGRRGGKVVRCLGRAKETTRTRIRIRKGEEKGEERGMG